MVFPLSPDLLYPNDALGANATIFNLEIEAKQQDTSLIP